MCIGVNTDLVVVGKIGADLRMDYTAAPLTCSNAAWTICWSVRVFRKASC